MKTSEHQSLRADRLLPHVDEVERVLGPTVKLESAEEHASMQNVGAVAAAAARDVAYRSMRGRIVIDDAARPLAVGELVLVFDQAQKAESTFAQIAEAAHLRIRLGDSNVAVETVTAPNGLVSYWGYVQLRDVLLVLTLDTLDPQDVSMSTFRSLVTLGAQKVQDLG